ncbi:MAG: tail fiber domain-containing protein [Tannerellaceae bacterium]|jgi:hypothetical protein|nr:tail fiber domain-containing protein [Tannerellaceae bacterium]
MKKLLLISMTFAFVANLSAQLKVDAAGQVGVGGTITTINNANVPITFKVNGVVAGYTGYSGKTNVSFGCNALSAATVTGNYNTASGGYALVSNTTGSNNTASGYCALSSNVAGNYNTAVGNNAGVAASGLNNITAIGYNASATSSNQVRIGNTSVTSIGGHAGWTTLSDKRAKKNVRPDVPGLAFINQLQPVTRNGKNGLFMYV